MKFLLDANMPRAALAAVAVHGYEVEHLRDTPLRDAADERIAAYARSSQATLVTRDLDFADTRRYPPADHHGLVVMRVADRGSAKQIADLLERFLSSTSFVAQLPGHLVIVEADRVRFRPALVLT